MAKQVALRRAQAQDEALENRSAVRQENIGATSSRTVQNIAVSGSSPGPWNAPDSSSPKPEALYANVTTTGAGSLQEALKRQHVQESLVSLLRAVRMSGGDAFPLVCLYAVLREADFDVDLAFAKLLEARLAVQSLATQDSVHCSSTRSVLQTASPPTPQSATTRTAPAPAVSSSRAPNAAHQQEFAFALSLTKESTSHFGGHSRRGGEPCGSLDPEVDRGALGATLDYSGRQVADDSDEDSILDVESGGDTRLDLAKTSTQASALLSRQTCGCPYDG